MSHPPIQRQYGLWDSSISSVFMARSDRIEDLAWDLSGALVWLERRGDRNVLVVQPPDGQAPRDLSCEYSVRGRVGYGGGDFTVGDGYVYFAEAGSGRIYRQPLASGSAVPVTPAFGYAAAPALSPDGRWLLFVHTFEGQDHLAIIDAEGRLWPQKLVSGDDFYMQPAWHPDGERIAWIAWNHPNMPWDGVNLRVGRLRFDTGGLPVLQETRQVAGDERTAVFQPEFSPDGRSLAYISDESGWGQLYLHDLETGAARQLTQAAAEHATPAWVQGRRTYALENERAYFLRNQGGFVSLWQVDLASGTEQRLPLDEGYTHLEQIAFSGAGPRQIALSASGSSIPPRVITVLVPGEQAGAGQVQIVRRATSEELPAEAYSVPEPLEWQGMDGGPVYGLFYSPQNKRFTCSGSPPLIVLVHGGPTSQSQARFNAQVQFFTSRGYAALEVNYRGSTGYGRAYQDALRGDWGIYDVQDSVSGARGLAEQGRVDGGRLVIMGGSAGGFTVLKAMEDYPGFFKAGICLYGVANQFLLATETHKFEAHYSDQLLGPLPEAAEIYRQRSPIFFVDRIKDPLAVFQGEDDPVVRRNQSDELVDSLRRRGVPHIYHVYPGEGHGFRKPETIIHFYEAVNSFLKQWVVFG